MCGGVGHGGRGGWNCEMYVVHGSGLVWNFSQRQQSTQWVKFNQSSTSITHIHLTVFEGRWRGGSLARARARAPRCQHTAYLHTAYLDDSLQVLHTSGCLQSPCPGTATSIHRNNTTPTTQSLRIVRLSSRPGLVGCWVHVSGRNDEKKDAA